MEAIMGGDRPVSTHSASESEIFTGSDDKPIEKMYIHNMNLTSADVRKKEKEKKMVEEEAEKIRTQKEILVRQKEEEKKRDMEMLRSFDPWGKPGAGAPVGDSKRKKHFGEMGPEQPDADNIFKFGQPGAGAPNRTKSGRIRTKLAGDPDIRFQNGQQVNLSVENHLRYKKVDKENYKNHLDNLVQEKQIAKKQELEWNKQQQEEMEKLYPFGRSKENDPIFLPTNPSQKKEEIAEAYNPWGKGYGNPGRDDKGNVLRHPTIRSREMGVPDPLPPEENLGLAFPISEWKGGNGYPHATKSGNVKTRLRKTLEKTDKFGNVISEDVKTDLEENYYPFGKPGAGAPFSREMGKNFMEKMGWSTTNPTEITNDGKKEYLNTLKQEIAEKKERDMKEKEKLREPTAEFVDVLQTKEIGKPKKDPITGEMKRTPRVISDVTSHKLDIRRNKADESIEYNSFLRQQTEQKQKLLEQQKIKDQEEIEQHQNKWDSFWGKPGNGAPLNTQNFKKENFSALLQNTQTEPYIKHYTTEIVPSKHKNFYEVTSTQDANNAIKKDYQFKTPWPAMT